MSEDTLGAIGCIGVVLAVSFAIAAAFLHINILHAIIVGGVIGLAFGVVGATAPEPEEKEKRKSKPKSVKGAIVQPRSRRAEINRQRDYSRLEVPGGYVPFEMTRTETKTKDSVKTETEIKTYVDAKEVKAILKGRDVKLLK